MNSETWTTQLHALKEYVRFNERLPTHNARIPKAERDPATVQLAYFVTNQRKNQDSLSTEQRVSRVALFDDGGVIFGDDARV